MKVTQSDPIRLEDFLAGRFPTLSLGTIRRAIVSRGALVNGAARQRKWRLRSGDDVEFDHEGVLEVRIEPKEHPLKILWEDEHAVVVDKPHGIGTVPDLRAADMVLVAGMHHILGKRPFVIHRLDRGTSGAIILAKTNEAAKWISYQFEHRLVEKEYLAVVDGVPAGPGVVEVPIGRVQGGDPAFQAVPDGLQAVTVYEITEGFGDFSLVTAKPRTGRTHQVRIHMAHAGYPLAVDSLYGRRAVLTEGDLGLPGGGDAVVMSRLTLHASRIVFVSPSKERVDVTAPIPDDLSALLAIMRGRRR